MRPADEMIDCLEHAKLLVDKMAWALSLHLNNGIGGGGYLVDQNSRDIKGWIDDAIDRIKTDAKWLEKATQDEKS